MDDATYARTIGLQDFGAPIRQAKPSGRLFTPAELAEMRQFEAAKAEREANAAYLGLPPIKPPHPDPLVREIAEMLMKELGG